MPLEISLVMPTKNAAHFVERSVGSFSSQSWPHRQLVVVDGGSEDKTVEKISRLISRRDILLLQADQNATQAVVRGVGLSSGDVVGLLMSDDWLEPGALAAIARAFETDPLVELICGGARVWGMENSIERIEEAIPATPGDVLDFDRLLGVPYMAAYFFRRQTWEALEGFCLDYRYGADRDFLVRALLAGAKAKGIDSFVYNYFRHKGSSTLVDRDDVVLEFLRDHRLMATRWMRRPGLSENDRQRIERWRRVETFALLERQLQRRSYRKLLSMITSDLVLRPKLGLQSGRQLLALMRRQMSIGKIG